MAECTLVSFSLASVGAGRCGFSRWVPGALFLRIIWIGSITGGRIGLGLIENFTQTLPSSLDT